MIRPLAIGVLLAACATALAAQRFPERPAQRMFVLDLADLIDTDDEAAIQTRCDRLLTDKKVPLKVVTIRSLAEYGADDIDLYARALFGKWGIGFPNANYGILLLVSKGDRRARIEMGLDWSNTGDDASEAIMRGLMAAFRDGRFSSGLATAAAELDAFARGKQPPERASERGGSRWANALAALVPVVLALIAGFFAFLMRGGGGGPTPPPMGRGGPFSARNRFSRSSAMPNALGGGGGFSGGSFGGGFGGGGGATGGW